MLNIGTKIAFGVQILYFSWHKYFQNRPLEFRYIKLRFAGNFNVVVNPEIYSEKLMSVISLLSFNQQFYKCYIFDLAFSI